MQQTSSDEAWLVMTPLHFPSVYCDLHVINDVDNLDYFCSVGSFRAGYNTRIFTYS